LGPDRRPDARVLPQSAGKPLTSLPPLTIGIDGRELQGQATGTGRYLRNLLRVWTRSGGDRLIVFFNGPAPADPVLDHPRLAVRPLGTAPTRGIVWQERRLPSAAATEGLDVFFSPAYVCPLRLELPRVTAVHDMSFFAMPEDFSLMEGIRRRALVTAAVRASAAIVTISEFTKREIESFLPGARGRITHVPLGPDDDLPPAPPRDDARRRLGVDGPLVLTVGSIFNRRRVPELLAAIARLASRFPKLVLDVVGENRTQPTLDLPALVRQHRIERHVRLSGFVSESALADRYAAADVAVFLSEYEGFGLPALEAMTRGVPVLASTRPALSEIFGPAASLVDPRDEAGIAAALERLLTDSSLRTSLVERGRALAARYSWQDTAARTREILTAAARR
jgi:glycosyltransferase involved in cell wall biosynthesis